MAEALLGQLVGVEAARVVDRRALGLVKALRVGRGQVRGALLRERLPRLIESVDVVPVWRGRLFGLRGVKRRKVRLGFGVHRGAPNVSR